MKIVKKTHIFGKFDTYCIRVTDKSHNFILENNVVVSNCGPSCHDAVAASGSGTVFVNGRPLVRIGDAVSCGGSSASGSGDVFAN